MSFLVDTMPSTDEDQFFVSEILSLFDVDDECWLTDPAMEKAQTKPSKVEQLPTRTHREKTVTPRRGRRVTSPQPRIRNKGKIEQLRREVATLEAELAALQHTEEKRVEQLVTREERRAKSLWKIVAMKQSQERERAEDRNKALKRLLTAQYALTSSLSGVLSEWTSLPTPDTSVRI
ncbi:hypothetical protein PHYBOEH_003200 [Phytophthora boehmeriae]|uniref:Uncharacterized protein n=1 Tax=Phytophthora boehmeriae TaxID=109152 RepID=A0A8T1WQM2_9STRA|nr:hypothetical protein PHYBOEH_003200 [Phytophthora boehmeriae]